MTSITILFKKIDAELLFTERDSLTDEIKSENVYVESFRWKKIFDFSNYPKGSKFFDETKKELFEK